MAEQIRTAVVGTGYFGRFHANHYSKNPRANLVAVVDADQARARTSPRSSAPSRRPTIATFWIAWMR